MIARFHYDNATLDRYLHDSLDGDSMDGGANEIASHIESCEECQTRVESMVEGGLTWDDVSELLGDDPNGDPQMVSSAARPATFLDASDDPDSLGRFARFEIKEILGQGGMGIVMRGYDTALQRHCAVKVLTPELACTSAARQRFSREARSAAAVVHPHVVPIQTVDEHDGLPYLVMPVIEGQSLQQRVEDRGPLEIIEVVRIASQIARGLAAAHEQGLVHRDIKPANILLENGVERVQITDFGLARAVDDASMTRSGVIAGTPQYMSPEQAHGDAIDYRSDLFSLGSLIYFMLTGRSPFRAENTMGVLNRISNDQPRLLRSVNSQTPAWLEQIVTKLLAKDPVERFQSAGDVAELLERWHAHLQTPEAVPAPAASTDDSRFGRGARWLIASGLAGFIALLGLIIVLETGKGTLRIETNSDSDIPVLIRRNGKIVDEMIATAEGASARLRAGEYIVEVKSDDPEIKLQGNTVSIEAGGRWVVRIEAQDTSEIIIGRPNDELARSADPPKLSAFTRMEFEKNQVLVTFNGKRYELLKVDDFAIGDLVRQTRVIYENRWKKRLSEDLVEVLWRVGSLSGAPEYSTTVDLQLKSLDSNEIIDVDNAVMTHEKRRILYRDNEHNQP